MQLLQCNKRHLQVHSLLVVTQKGPNSKKRQIGREIPLTGVVCMTSTERASDHDDLRI